MIDAHLTKGNGYTRKRITRLLRELQQANELMTVLTHALNFSREKLETARGEEVIKRQEQIAILKSVIALPWKVSNGILPQWAPETSEDDSDESGDTGD